MHFKPYMMAGGDTDKAHLQCQASQSGQWADLPPSALKDLVLKSSNRIIKNYLLTGSWSSTRVNGWLSCSKALPQVSSPSARPQPHFPEQFCEPDASTMAQPKIVSEPVDQVVNPSDADLGLRGASGDVDQSLDGSASKTTKRRIIREFRQRVKRRLGKALWL